MRAKLKVLAVLAAHTGMLAGCAPGGGPPPTNAIACVRFGPPPALGTSYGPANGNPPGTLAFTEARIRVQVDSLFWTGGGTMNVGQIVAPPASIGSGQTGRANNISWIFDFSGLGWTPSSVDFVFLDQGGVENFAVNGSARHIGELTAAPASMGGASVTTVNNPAPGGKSGAVTILGPAINRVLVGGQEFWIDEVCARH